MDISLIVTAHNSTEYFDECIKSCLIAKQRFYGKCELILSVDNIDNGLFDDYKHYFKKVIFTNTNSNLANNFNKAVSVSLGKYVKILAYDDIINPEALNELFEAVYDNDADVVFANFISFSNVDNNIIEVPYKTPVGKYTTYGLIVNKKMSSGASMFKRSSYLAVGGMDTKYNIAEGLILYLRLFNKGFRNFVYLPYCTIRYRIHDNQKSSRQTKLQKMERDYIINQILSEYASKEIETHR